MNNPELSAVLTEYSKDAIKRHLQMTVRVYSCGLCHALGACEHSTTHGAALYAQALLEVIHELEKEEAGAAQLATLTIWKVLTEAQEDEEE